MKRSFSQSESCLFALFLALGVFTCVSANSESTFHSNLPCKYSVRDVGFVDVHGPSWQLRLLKPEIAKEKFETLAKQVAAKLERSNVGHLWLATNTEEAKNILASSEKPGVWGELTSPDGRKTTLIGLPDSNPSNFINNYVESLVASEIRNRLLSETSKRLCVVFVLESTDVEKNKQASAAADRAVDSLTKQMWTLEKAVDQPPIKIQITQEQLESDPGLRHSFPSIDETAVVIIYGQGRILGDVVSGNNIGEKKIVSLASITGRDCECDLDREWLYGKQILHRWSLELERSAETTLNFDPHSNIVKAEVAQIIRKTGTRKDSTGFDSVNLGNGLVIHDLDALEKQHSESKQDQKGKVDSSEDKPELKKSLTDESGPNEEETKSVSEQSVKEQSVDNEFKFPWMMATIVAIVGALAATFFWLRVQGS